MSTKLKLLGVGMASSGITPGLWFKRQFNDNDAKAQGLSFTVQANPFSGLYRKMVFTMRARSSWAAFS